MDRTDETKTVLQATDTESLEEEEGTAPAFKWWRPRTFALVGVGLVAINACTALTLTGKVPQSVQSGTTIRELIESPGMADVMTDNIMAASKKAPEERPALHAEVVDDIRRFTEDVQEGDPETRDKLDSFKLSHSEQAATVRALRLLGDKRALELAEALKSALRSAATSDGDPTGNLKHHIAVNMEQHADKIGQLREEMFPRVLMGSRHRDAVVQHSAVDPAKNRWVRSFEERQDDWRPHFVDKASNGVPHKRSQQTVTGHAVADHITILFDMMSERFDTDFSVQRSDSLRRLQSDLPYNVGCDTSQNTYTNACTSMYVQGMACNPTCEGYGSMFDCVKGAAGFKAKLECLTDGGKGAFASTFGSVWDSIKSTFGWDDDSTTVFAGNGNSPTAYPEGWR